MALWEGGVLAGIVVALGIAPKRTMPPLAVPVLSVPDAWCDTSTDTSASPTSIETSPPSKGASTRAFVKWWRSLDDVPVHVTQRYLCGLYAEFCEHENLIPLSDRQLMNAIKKHGVRSMRPAAKVVRGKLHRPTLYSLAPRRKGD